MDVEFKGDNLLLFQKESKASHKVFFQRRIVLPREHVRNSTTSASGPGERVINAL